MKRNTFCVRFYCRQTNARKNGKAPVECSIIIRGERVFFQLPKYCEPEKFKKLKASDDIMIFMHNVENKLNEIYTSRSLAGEPISAFILKDIYLNGSQASTYTLQKMFDEGVELKSHKSIELIRKYHNLIKLFYKFTGFSPSKPADTVTRNDILKLIPCLEKVHSPQTVAKDIQRLKYFWTTAFASGKIKSVPFVAIKYSAPTPEGEFLTQEEIAAVRNLRIDNYRLEKIQAVFLFLCYSGLEYADLKDLSPEDIQTSATGQKYIKKPRVKTGVEYISVLYEDAIDIIEEYKGLLPICSCQKFNTYVKELVQMAGIDKNVTSLTARHSYAVYLLSYKNLNIEIVSKMLGHTNTKQSYTYAKLLEKTVLEANSTAVKKGNPELSEEELEEFQKLFS